MADGNCALKRRYVLSSSEIVLKILLVSKYESNRVHVYSETLKRYWVVS